MNMWFWVCRCVNDTVYSTQKLTSLPCIPILLGEGSQVQATCTNCTVLYCDMICACTSRYFERIIHDASRLTDQLHQGDPWVPAVVVAMATAYEPRELS